jgi:hypothetical protein
MICRKKRVLKISKIVEIIKSPCTLFSFLNFIVLPHLIFVVLSNLENSPKIHLCGLSFTKTVDSGMVVTVSSEKTCLNIAKKKFPKFSFQSSVF